MSAIFASNCLRFHVICRNPFSKHFCLFVYIDEGPVIRSGQEVRAGKALTTTAYIPAPTGAHIQTNAVTRTQTEKIKHGHIDHYIEMPYTAVSYSGKCRPYT